MSGDNQVGDQNYNLYNCDCENCNPKSYASPTFDNYLSVEERVELIELKSKVEMYETICSPEKLKELWRTGFFSGKLAQETNQITNSDMEKFYSEDIEEIIKDELKNLDLSEELSNGEFEEE